MRTSVIASALLALASVAAVATAQSGKTWDKSYPVSAHPSVEIHTGEAAIHTTACGACRAVTVHIDMHDQDLKDYTLEERSSGNHIYVELKRRESGWRNWGSSGKSPEVVVVTPAESDVTLKAGSGGVQLAGVSGAITVAAGSGGVQVRESGGKLEASAGSGGLAVEGAFTQFRMHAGSGSVSAQLRPGTQLSSDSEITAGSGGINLGLPRDLHADVRATTGSGQFHSDIPMTTLGDYSRHSLNGKLNGGGPQLRVTAGSGGVNIRNL